MHNQKLKMLVTEAVVLDRQIAERTAQLKDIKADLIQEAKLRENEQTVTDGGGRSWVAEDLDGNISRVTFPASPLKGSIEGEGKTIQKIREVAGNFFVKLFNQSPRYIPVDTFRADAKVFLGNQAGKLIKLCTSQSKPTVSFETKDPGFAKGSAVVRKSE
jgi:hypothetical protein